MSDAVNPFEPPSLLLTPVFGSVLVRKNWRALGDESKVRAGTIWIVVSVLMLFVAVVFGLVAVFVVVGVALVPARP